MQVHEYEEWQDNDLGRALAYGTLVGAPLVWVIMTALCTWRGVDFGPAAGLSLLPAFFLGPWAGGLIFMGRASTKHEHEGEVVELHAGPERKAA